MNLRHVLSIVFFVVCFLGCSTDKIYTVEGTVIEVMDDGRLMLEHEDIDGFMAAMTMPFNVASPEVIHGVRAGDRIVGQLVVGEKNANYQFACDLDHDRVDGYLGSGITPRSCGMFPTMRYRWPLERPCSSANSRAGSR